MHPSEADVENNGKVGSSINTGHGITHDASAENGKTSHEAHRRQDPKMESVGRLAGGVAHDLNNMLSVISGYAQLALMDANLPPSLLAALKEINNATERSADFTRQLLAIARKQVISPTPLDLNDTVGGMLPTLQQLAGREIQLVWKPAQNLWPVRMDLSQIGQMLAKLCINARDAICGNGTITIETGNCILDKGFCAARPGCLAGDYVRLAVSDTGCGMDKETLAHVFEPFFSTGRSGKNAGLGLAVVYGIVKQNSGYIDVDSEPGLGATFAIYLPRHGAAAALSGIGGTNEPTFCSHETILLVEDDPDILKITAQMLEMLGYVVLTAHSSNDAIRLSREYTGEIHLLMTDVILPGMNGHDLAKRLLSEYPHMKHLFMSGYTATVVANHGMPNMGINFIQKPFSLSALADKVRGVFDGASMIA